MEIVIGIAPAIHYEPDNILTGVYLENIKRMAG